MSDIETRPWVPKHNPWLIAITVSMATFMEVLDSSVANVALPHIAGSFGASQDESTWVLTSYLVSNAVILPLAAYLSTLMGRKRFYMICVALFGISSLLCGLAPTLPMLLFFRVLQGLGGGGLGPSEQSILADTFPPAKRGQAFALYGLAIVMAPTLGPTVGGWITDNFDWRWIFFINLPVVVLSLYMTNRLVEDTPTIQREVKEARSGNFRVDYLGFGLLALTFGCLEVVLDKGQEDDWFGSAFIVTFLAISVASLIAVIFWELRLARTQQRPILDLMLFKNRTFGLAVAMMFVLGCTLYGVNTLLPQLLQNLMHYTAEQSGITLSSGGLATLLCMPLVGILIGKVDPPQVDCAGLHPHCRRSFLYERTRSPDEYGLRRKDSLLPIARHWIPIHSNQHHVLCRGCARQEQRCCRHDESGTEYWWFMRHGDLYNHAGQARTDPSGRAGPAYRSRQCLLQQPP